MEAISNFQTKNAQGELELDPVKYSPWLNSFAGIRYPKSQKAKFIHCVENLILPFQNSGQKNKGALCPPTFDGYGCWNQTSPGVRAYIECPEFVTGFDPRRRAFKDCMPDATWFRHPLTQKVWSNYTTCIDIRDYKMRERIVNLYIIGYAISLVAVLLALLIFWKFKSLECTRVRIHRQLFYSFVGNNLSRILWHSITGNLDILLQNRFSCQFVHLLSHYFMCCNYMWMFCEGLYLHTLITMALRNLKHIVAYLCLIGWGLPVVLIVAYTTCRILTHQTQSCWLDESPFKWILNGPIIASIIVSIVFLINIIRILIAKLTSYNSAERNQVSKAVKATLILLPLLGVHYVITPIRPAPGSKWEPFYEYMAVILVSFQGFFVASIFCFFNGAVIKVLKHACTTSSCYDQAKAKYSQVTLRKSLDGRFQKNVPQPNMGTANVDLITTNEYHSQPSIENNELQSKIATPIFNPNSNFLKPTNNNYIQPPINDSKIHVGATPRAKTFYNRINKFTKFNKKTPDSHNNTKTVIKVAKYQPVRELSLI